MELIKLPHKVLDYTCPINGLEDQYEWKTGCKLEGFGLMDLATIGFTYIKQKNAPAPRMIFWGSGMGKPLFTFLSDIIGFEWSFQEGKAFNTAWKTALEHLQSGTPVLLGLLDMYHLHYYPKFYHRVHIPQHFVLLVGFDEVNNSALVQDNGLADVQSIPLEDLKAAWNVNVPGQGKPYSLFILHMSDTPASEESIWRNGLKKRAALYLNPPIGFMGVKGMRKAQKEISNWVNEMDEHAWQESLRSLATFTCSVVPNLPQPLLPFNLGYKDPHQACRDRFANELESASHICREDGWNESAALFRDSGKQIGYLTDLTVSALSGKKEAFCESSDVMKQILTFEEKAFSFLQ